MPYGSFTQGIRKLKRIKESVKYKLLKSGNLFERSKLFPLFKSLYLTLSFMRLPVPPFSAICLKP